MAKTGFAKASFLGAGRGKIVLWFVTAPLSDDYASCRKEIQQNHIGSERFAVSISKRPTCAFETQGIGARTQRELPHDRQLEAEEDDSGH
jgi:hypothetical protein